MSQWYRDPVLHFVVVYDRKRRALVNIHEFADREEAVRRRWALDAEHQANGDIEIVVLSALSEKDLQTSHGRYFKPVADLAS